MAAETIKKPYVKLVGEEGDAMAIIGRTMVALRKAGNSKEVCEAYFKEATSGDFDHVLVTTLEHTTQDKTEAAKPKARRYSDLARLEEAFDALRALGLDARENFMCCGTCAAAALDAEKGAVYWHKQDDESAFGWTTYREQCYVCRGSGAQECDECRGSGTDDEGEECQYCQGSGEGEYCYECDGDGEITEETEDRESDDLKSYLYLGYGGRDDEHTVEVGKLTVAALEEAGFDVEWDGNPAQRIKVLA